MLKTPSEALAPFARAVRAGLRTDWAAAAAGALARLRQTTSPFSDLARPPLSAGSVQHDPRGFRGADAPGAVRAAAPGAPRWAAAAADFVAAADRLPVRQRDKQTYAKLLLNFENSAN